MEQLPASLKVLKLFIGSPGFSCSSDLFARCTNLTILDVTNVRAKNLDFRHCASLQSVYPEL